MKNRTDSYLYKRLASGDKNALADVYLAYKNEFLFYFKSFQINREALLDIYQDSIVVIYQKFLREGLELKESSLKTYLFGIGKNKVYTYFKHNKIKNIDLSRLKIEDDNYTDSEPNPYAVKLSEKLNELSYSCKRVLEFYYYRGFTIKEIVEATGYKDENTVKSHKSRCLKRLKQLCKAS